MQMKDVGWQNGLAPFRVRKADGLVVIVRRRLKFRLGWEVEKFMEKHAG